MNLPKTPHQCDARQEDLQICTSQLYNRQFNSTAASPTTAIKFRLKQESRKMKTSTTIANHDPRMNRTNPKYRALLGIIGTLSTSCKFLQLLVDCLVCSRYCLQLLCVFLECVLLPCTRACFWPPGLKNPLVFKTQLGNLTKMWFPSHLFISARVAYVRY
jgi:hypothetical protein